MTKAIAINVYRESTAQISECFKRVEQNMLQSTVRIFCNGVVRPEVQELAAELGFSVTTGPNYGTNARWNLWWLRMLKFFTGSQANVCFKLDPDTMVDAPLRCIPNVDYFGTISHRKNVLFVQGGITGLSQRAVKALLSSGFLENPRFCTFCTSISAGNAFMDDQLLALALRQIDILPTSWEECQSRWREPVANRLLTHTIVHPRYY